MSDWEFIKRTVFVQGITDECKKLIFEIIDTLVLDGVPAPRNWYTGIVDGDRITGCELVWDSFSLKINDTSNRYIINSYLCYQNGMYIYMPNEVNQLVDAIKTRMSIDDDLVNEMNSLGFGNDGVVPMNLG